MDLDLCAYNIRGLNNKKTFVKDFISINKLSIIAIVETHVKVDSASYISNFICPRLSWTF